MPTARTIFDKILDGELPCHRVLEDEYVLAFLDIAPLAPGHTLLIPKQRVACFHELDPEHAAAIGRALPRVARAVMAASGASAYNLLQNNGALAHQAVAHVHVHVIPKLEGQGLGLGWAPGSLANEDAARLLGLMRAELG